jgi:hypothetical protein
MLPDKKIKTRQSYEMFSRIADALDNSIEGGLIVLFNEMDSMQAFKSRKNAIAARESLDLLLNERQTK